MLLKIGQIPSEQLKEKRKTKTKNNPTKIKMRERGHVVTVVQPWQLVIVGQIREEWREREDEGEKDHSQKKEDTSLLVDDRSVAHRACHPI